MSVSIRRISTSPRMPGEGITSLARLGGRGLGIGWPLKPLALAAALVAGSAGPAAASDDMKALLAEVKAWWSSFPPICA